MTKTLVFQGFQALFEDNPRQPQTAHAPQAAVKAIEVIRDGIEILERHPFVGRPCEEGLRELLISYGKSGYVALYSYEQSQNVVLVLSIRHQREAGYST